VLAVLVIAIFYSSRIDPRGICVAVAGISGILILQRFGVRRVASYIIPAMVVWIGIWWAGIHPTFAGIIVGLLTPARTWYGHEGLADAARQHIEVIDHPASDRGTRLRDLARSMLELRRAHREAVSLVERIEAALHAWTAFAIIPAFAFANAGIDFEQVDVATAPRLAVVQGLRTY
jgi:NhaA family Na+:H+ antiporter